MKNSKHPSFRKIRSFAQINGYLKFQEVTLEQINSEIEGLNPKKATTFGNIPARVLKKITFSESMQLIFNNCIQTLSGPIKISRYRFPPQIGGENQ